MTHLKPYLIRASYDWIVDNGMTPHILVDAEHAETDVPPGYVQNGKIVLNMRPEAVQSLSLGNQKIEFSARFGGVPTYISFSIAAVLAIYAKENGQGMAFENESESDSDNNFEPEPQPAPPTKPSKPHLKVVK